MSEINLTLTEGELATTIAALLFAGSVNITSSTNSEYQHELFNLAKKLKQNNPDIQMENIQFVKEENYEDEISEKVYEEFKNNLEIVTFEEI